MIFWLVARASFHAGRPIPKNMLSVSCAKHQGHHQLFSTLRTTGASHRGRLNRLNPLDPQFISPTPLFAELNQADQPNPPLEQPNRGLGSTGSRRARARRRAGVGDGGEVERRVPDCHSGARRRLRVRPPPVEDPEGQVLDGELRARRHLHERPQLLRPRHCSALFRSRLVCARVANSSLSLGVETGRGRPSPTVKKHGLDHWARRSGLGWN